MPDEKRLERLRQLTPLELTKGWLEGDLCLDDEAVLIEVLRKDKKIRLPDDKVIDFIEDVMRQGNVSPEGVLERLELAA